MKTLIIWTILAFLLTSVATPASAQRGGLSIIRDAEIEEGIRELATPIFQAAGVNPDSVSIVIVNTNTINAFVTLGQRMFINTGLLLETDEPLELIGVIAHETGHIAGGHLVRLDNAVSQASAEALLTTLLGVVVGVAAGDGSIGAATAAAGRQFAERRLLAFSRVQENSADAAAINYLNRTNYSPRGLAEFFEKLGEQELLPSSQQDEYVRTHPLSRDRVNTMRAALSRYRGRDGVPPRVQDIYDRMIAKLVGYLQPRNVAYRYSNADQSVPARYARAVAAYRQGRIEQALSAVDALIAEEPDNAFFYELKGQILLENFRIIEAIPPYRRATELAPEAGLLSLALGHALIESGDPSLLQEARVALERAQLTEQRSQRVHRLLATVYGRTGSDGLARLHLAEEAMLAGRTRDAIALAEHAQNLLPNGSPGWLRAQDIKLIAEDMES